MAVLSDSTRTLIWAGLMENARDFLGAGEEFQASKVEYRQLIDDIDTWLDSQATAANSAIRVGIRSKFTTTEKFRVLALIAAKRGGLGRIF